MTVLPAPMPNPITARQKRIQALMLQVGSPLPFEKPDELCKSPVVLMITMMSSMP